MKIPLTKRFLIESKVYFHYFTQLDQPGIYKAAREIVQEDKLVEIDIGE